MNKFFDDAEITIDLEKEKIIFLKREICDFLKNEKKINKILSINKNLYFIPSFVSLNIFNFFLKNKLDAYIKKTKYNNKKIKFLTYSLYFFISTIIEDLILFPDLKWKSILLSSFMYGTLNTFLENKINIFISNLILFLSSRVFFIPQMPQLLRLELLKTFFEEDIDNIDRHEDCKILYWNIKRFNT